MSQNFIYQDYQKNIKLFLYTPDNKLLGELDAFNIRMSLSLKNFSMLEFELPARFFDYETNSMIFNHQIVKTLDMYQVEVEVGDLSPGSNGYETRRFVITERPVSIKGSKASYSYKAFSLEHELKSIPIVNWPGVEVKAYRKQFDTITATSNIQNTLNILPANAAIDQIFVYRKFISEGGIRDVEEFLDRVEIGGSPTNSEIYAQLSESQYYINLSPKITTQTTTINQNFTINQFIERYQPWIGNFFALANEKSFNVNFPTGGESIFAVNSLSVSLAAGTLPSPNNIRFSLSFFNKGNLVLRSPSYTYAEISSAINLSVKAAVDKIIIKVSDYGSTIPNLYTLLINSINFSTSDVPKIYWKIPQNQRIQGKNNQIVANGHPDSYYEIDEHALVVYHPFSNDIVPAPEENEPKYTEDFYYLTDGITFEQVINDIYTKQNKDFFQWIIDANSFDPSIKEEVRSGLSVNNTNWYDFLKKLGEDFDIHIDYDTQNRRINFIHNDSFGEDINLVYEYGKYNNGVTQDYITTNMYNYVQGYDGSNVGFGVESFSGDNYYEDYTYLLEGAQWNPLTQNITKSSRFLSDDLTKVLAKKKHMIEQYEEEVFGNNFARVGLLQTRTERLKKEWPIQFEIAEIENKLINFKNLLDSYNKKSAQEKNLLRTWTKAMSIPLNQGFSKKEVFFPATAESVFKFSPTDIQKEVEYVLDFPTEGPSQITDINTFIFTFANDWKISFKADNTKRGIPVRSPIISYQPDTISLKLELYDSNGVPIHTETIRNKYYNTVRGVGNSTNYQAAFKPFLDNDTVITKLVLTVTARKDHTFNYYLDPELKSIENRLQPVSIVFYPGNNTTEGKEFIGYEPYLKYMIQYTENELLVKQTLLDTMKQARPQNYTIDQPFTEAFENIAGQFGSSTLSNRLEYIQGVTSWRDADFTGYSTSMANLKSELKTIRRGAVYQNKDIFDGGMLLKAAKQFLEDNRYPEITISIDTISILDSSELKSKWSNLKIGDYIYIYINELELFIKAQIQDLKYNFETYKLGMTITNRNEYTPGVLGKLGKMFMKVKDESQNILITGKNTNSKPTPPRRGAPLGSNFGGVLINTEGQVETPEPEQAPQNSSESVQTSTHPMTNQEQGYPAPHLEGTVITQGYMNVTPGALVVTNNNRETIITISAGEGIVAEKFKIDLEGNATFAGDVEFGTTNKISTLDTDYNEEGIFIGYDTDTYKMSLVHEDEEDNVTFFRWDGEKVEMSGTITATGIKIVSPDSTGDIYNKTEVDQFISTINGIIDELETQIDGAISTWFAEGIPTLSNFPVVNVVTPAESWTTDEIKNVHLGDLYYDTVTGYAYRFALVGSTYEWIQITDTDVVAALANAATAQATADGKMTYFTASNLEELDNRKTLAKLGDVLIPSATITDTGVTPNVIYTERTIYTYNGEDFVPEEKKDGSVGGWTINTTELRSNNQNILLDAVNSKITIGKNDAQLILNGAAVYNEDEQINNTVLEHSKFKIFANGDAEFEGILKATAFIETAAGNFNSQDFLRVENNITGGTRSILFNFEGNVALPTTSEIFTASPLIGLVSWPHVTFSWTAEGVMSGTSSSSTFQPTISQTFATGTLVTVVVNYYINSTTTEANKFATKTDVIGINVEKIGEKGENGGPGPSGEQGLIGLRTVSGRVYFIYTTGTLPTEPIGPLTYDITSGTFDDALPTGWSLVQPTFEAGSQDDYYYSDFTGIETESSGGKAEISNFSTPVKAINFSGLVTFTGTAGEAISTTNSNITSIDGGLLSTAKIDSSEVIPNTTSPKMTIALNDQFISIGQEVQGYDKVGVFLGYDSINDVGQLSLVSDGNHLKWTGDTLDLQGDLGGTIGKISVEGETGLIEITEDGVFGYKDKENKNDSSFSLTKNGELTLEGTITATAGDIGGWEIQKLDSGSSGIFSGGVFLKDGQLGKVGELTISSDGYISGRKFSIQKNGSASFNDLKALASVDLGDVKRQIVTQAIDWAEQVTQKTLTSTCSFDTCYTIIRQVSFATRDINFLTISKLIDESDEFILNKQYNFIFKNGSTIVNSLGLASSGREVFDSEKIFDFGQTIRSVNSITLEIQHLPLDSGKIVKIRNGVVSSSASNLQIKSIKDTATPADFDRILMIDDSDKQIVKGGPEFNTSVNNRTRFLRNDGTWQAPAIFLFDTNGISSVSGGTIDVAYRLRQTIGSLTIQHVYGIATVTNNLGTMIINLSDVLLNDIVMVTPKDADSGASGSGVNLFYGDKVSGAYRITHDRSGTTNTTRTFYFDIFGTL